jgi:hypothetical protein
MQNKRRINKRVFWCTIAAISISQFLPLNSAIASQDRSLPAGYELYALACDGVAKAPEGQLAMVNATSGVMTRIGVGITDTNIRSQIGTHSACAVGATYNSILKKAYYVTGYKSYNLKNALYQIDLITGASTYIAGLTPGNSISGADSSGYIDVRGIATDSSGRMYAFWKGISDSQFYVGVVDKLTGMISESQQIESTANSYFLNEDPNGFTYFNNSFYTVSPYPRTAGSYYLYAIDINTGNVTSAASGDNNASSWYGLAVDVNGVLWNNEAKITSATISGWSVAGDAKKSDRSYQWYVWQFLIAPSAASLTEPAAESVAATAKAAAESVAATAKAAAEVRARAVEVAKTEIKSVLSSGKPLTADQLLSADFNGVTTKNIGLVNADIAKLSDLDKTDLKQIEKVVLKFATVDKLAEGKTVYSSDLIAVGLIPQDSKIKSSITSALKKLPASTLDSFEKIQAEIASVEKVHADRKARLAAILAKKL